MSQFKLNMTPNNVVCLWLLSQVVCALDRYTGTSSSNISEADIPGTSERSESQMPSIGAKWRFNVPGKFVDVVFKSERGHQGHEIALVREFQQEGNTPLLSRDFHPDHRPVSHHQLYVQSDPDMPASRRLVGFPIDGHCRSGHTYYMASEVGDYILSSSLTFVDPESVIGIFLTWTAIDLRQKLYQLSYNFEKDCRVHDFVPSGNTFVSSLPHYDCPWASIVPSPKGNLLALMHHSSKKTPYKVYVEILSISHDYVPTLFKTKLNFDKVHFEEAIFYHWIDDKRFRIYGGSSSYEISVDRFGVSLIPFNRKAKSLQKTNSGRISEDGSKVLVLDRANDFEPKLVPKRTGKPFG